jgi:hypothetical protein
MTRLFRLLSLAAVAVAAFVAAGCGKEEHARTVAETEGIYLDIGELKYQVQVSREMNAQDVEDRGYLTGLPAGEEPNPDEAWFGVFLRVQNTHTSGEPLPTAREFEIVDTQERVYKPVAIDTKQNVFAYTPINLEPRSLVPADGSLASTGPTQGTLLLFRLTIDSLANRPLEFHIKSPTNPAEVGTVNLDV